MSVYGRLSDHVKSTRALRVRSKSARCFSQKSDFRPFGRANDLDLVFRATALYAVSDKAVSLKKPNSKPFFTGLCLASSKRH
jgi:hypothetical protein